MMSADHTYKERLADVRELLRRLDGQLKIHERRQRAQPADWGFPGDLGSIADRLRDLTPKQAESRCEWRHPKACEEEARICTPDGRLLCFDHAVESDSDPRECLDVVDGTPIDED